MTDKPLEWRERPAWMERTSWFRAAPAMAGVAVVQLVRWFFGSPAWYAVVASMLLVLAVVQLTRQPSRQ